MGPGTTREHPGLCLTGPNGECKAERERDRNRQTERKTPDRNVGKNDKERANQ